MNISQEEHIRVIELANLWKARAVVAGNLAKYFNSIYYADGSPFFDVKKEIEMQADRLLKQNVHGMEVDFEKTDLELGGFQ